MFNAQKTSGVSENYFEHFMTGTPASGIEVVTNKSNGNRYLHNGFHNVNKDLTLRSNHDALVFGNTFTKSGGIRIYGVGHRVLNNRFDYSQNPGWDLAAITVGFGNPGGADMGGCRHSEQRTWS